MTSTNPAAGDSAPTSLDVEIAVIGAGTAGTSAAAAFSKQGHSVALIDIHARHPADFRAEKIGQEQMDHFEAFGLGEAAYAHMTHFDGVWVHRFNRIIEKKTTREYSSHYPDLVNALRAGLPPDVHMVIGRVEAVDTGPERQVVSLADGRQIGARLVVVATGLGDVIRRKIGIEKTITSPAHSVAFGFDLARPPSDFPFPSLVWTSEKPSEKAAYLTLFPIGDVMRANFFTYRDVTEPWSHAFRKDPAATIETLFPRFEPTFGRIDAAGPVTARPVDLLRVDNYRRPGVVLLGDAFFTVCPSSGTGMAKALNDVARLSAYVPKWLATPGMGTEKIASFYADAAKRELDTHALRISRRARSMRMDRAVIWTARRLRAAVLTRSAYRVRDLLQPLVAPRAGAQR